MSKSFSCLSLKLERCYLSAIFLVSLQELTFLAFFPYRSPNESVNCISALNLYAGLSGVIYVKNCLISRELGTSNILTICCQIVHHKISFSLQKPVRVWQASSCTLTCVGWRLGRTAPLRHPKKVGPRGVTMLVPGSPQRLRWCT